MEKRKINEDEIIGKQIGIYKILYLCDYRDKYHHRLFHVKCTECGNEFDRRLTEIQHENKKCNHVDRFGNLLNTKFQWKNKRIGSIFRGMKDRCYNLNCSDYNNWGARGIKICDEWLKNPKSFENWSLSNGYEDNLTIDRIDSSKGYSPNNCQWITLSENVKKKDISHFIEIDGKIGTCRDWSEWTNIGKNAISKFINKYGEELVKEFIRRRLANPELTRKSKQTWMNVYGLED